jgi:hypothetical protein
MAARAAGCRGSRNSTAGEASPEDEKAQAQSGQIDRYGVAFQPISCTAPRRD